MNLKQQTIKLSMITGFTVPAGIIFHILLGRKFGPIWQMDCLFMILALFGWLSVFNNFIVSMYIPIFNEVKKNNPDESLIFMDIVLKYAVIMSVVIVSIILLFDNIIIKLLAPGFDVKGIALSKELNQIIAFALIFHSLSNTALLMLNSLYYYSVPAIAELFDPFFNITAIFVLVPFLGIKGIAISYLISNFSKMSFLLIYLSFKTGWKPKLHFYHPKLPELINKSSKMTFSGFIWSLRDIITKNIASCLGEGAVTLFSYADKFINIIIQVAVNPLLRVYYSRVSEWVALSLWSDIKALSTRAVRINVSLVMFISAAVITFLYPLLTFFLFKSKFTPEYIHILSRLTDIMLVYLTIFSFESYFSRIIFATQRVGVVAINVTVGIITLFIAALFLSKSYGLYGIAYAIVISQSLVCALYYLFIRKKLGIDMRGLFTQLSGGFFIALFFIVLGIVLKKMAQDNVFTIVVFCLPVWLLLYVAAAKIFLKEEMNILFSK